MHLGHHWNNVVERAIRDHVAAFNAHNLHHLLLGVSEEVVWQTAQDTFRGRDELAAVFSEAFRTIASRLIVRSMFLGHDGAACELQEEMTVDGAERKDFIAGFYRVDAGGVITSVKIYRQGSAYV